MDGWMANQRYFNPAKYLADNLRPDFITKTSLGEYKYFPHTLPAPFNVQHELIDLASFTRHSAYFAARRSFLDLEPPHPTPPHQLHE
jgi:hypothetical protein